MQELFRKEVLRVERGTHSWQDAVRIAGDVLLQEGSVDPPYTDAMINAVAELGPYMVVAPHIAIAHAAAGVHVNKNDMGVVVFKEPVLFHCENDPVHLMLVLCALEPHSHLEQFKSLADILVDEEVWERFRDCNTIQELYDLVNNYST